MQKQKSIKGDIIQYDISTKQQSIDDILANRFKNVKFIDGTIDDLYNPYLLADMKKAIDRIDIAIKEKQTVMVFGDYDVDGVTSTSLVVHILKKLGVRVSYRVPHRVDDGYGLKSYFMDEFAKIGVDLVITVDCGTRDIDVVKHAKTLGIDVIITDHHSVPEIIPDEAIAVINPKRTDCEYPFSGLAGAGVAFKLVMALAQKYLSADEAKAYIQSSIDIAAIGTVADCMDLKGENRVIVIEGLKQIRQSRSRGIRILLEEKLDIDIDADIFGFQIGPRLNAAGRLDTPYKAVNLLLNNSDSIYQTISQIEQLNEQRKHLTRMFVDEALTKINPKDNMLFYYSSAIDHGVIGIVAGRLTEKYYKPSIVLKDEGEKLVASCRSPDYFSMIDVLEEHKDMFMAFGGHKQAAGFSIARDKFGAFKTSVLEKLNKQDFSKHRKITEITKVVDLNELGFGFLRKVNRYKPFGMGNPKPLFLAQNLAIEKVEILGKNSRDHLRFTTAHGFKIFAFGFGSYLQEIKQANRVDLIFDISEDSWMGKKNLMLKVIDVIIE